MNSVNEGLAADVPLLLIPQGGDQFLIARRIQQLGAGKALQGRNLSAKQLRSSAETILTTPMYRQRSARLGAALRAAGGPAAAADAIEAYKRKIGL